MGCFNSSLVTCCAFIGKACTCFYQQVLIAIGRFLARPFPLLYEHVVYPLWVHVVKPSFFGLLTGIKYLLIFLLMPLVLFIQACMWCLTHIKPMCQAVNRYVILPVARVILAIGRGIRKVLQLVVMNPCKWLYTNVMAPSGRAIWSLMTRLGRGIAAVLRPNGRTLATVARAVKKIITGVFRALAGRPSPPDSEPIM